MSEPLAVYGAMTGTVGAVGVVWRIFEWWLNNRLNVQVEGSAGTATLNEMGQPVFASGQRFGYEHIAVEVINNSRQPIAVHATGFQDRRGTTKWVMTPLMGQLPKSLGFREKIMIVSEPREMSQAISSGEELIPYCRDGEGNTHVGKIDQHFERMVARLRNTSRVGGMAND